MYDLIWGSNTVLLLNLAGKKITVMGGINLALFKIVISVALKEANISIQDSCYAFLQTPF